MDHHAIPERTRKRRGVGVAAMGEPLPCLPEDLLDVIFSRLPSFADRACCASVCRAWRNAAMRKEHEAPPRLPLLLRPSSIIGEWPSYFGVFSKTTTKQPAIPENVRGARFCGSSAGGKFIIARRDQEGHDKYALLNVLSGEETALPNALRLHGTDDDEEGTALVILAATVSPRLNPEGGGDYVVAAIATGQHNAVFCSVGHLFWSAVDEDLGPEEFEDVTFYDSQEVEERGFYFLTSSDGFLVFNPQYDDEGGYYNDIFHGEGPRLQPIAGLVVAGRYLVESRGMLLMVQRFVSPGHERDTVSFRVLELGRPEGDDLRSWSATDLSGTLLFVGRGCSRSVDTGRSGPAFIYFLDDAEGFPADLDVTIHAENQQLYRRDDAGWFRNDTGYVEKSWPQGPLSDCSPWIWFHH